MKQLYLNSKLFEGTEEQFINIETFFHKEWQFNDIIHREDGPAWIDTGGFIPFFINHRLFNNLGEVWFKMGLVHRVNGPAIIDLNNKKYWFYENTEIETVFPINILYEEKETK